MLFTIKFIQYVQCNVHYTLQGNIKLIGLYISIGWSIGLNLGKAQDLWKASFLESKFEPLSLKCINQRCSGLICFILFLFRSIHISKIWLMVTLSSGTTPAFKTNGLHSKTFHILRSKCRCCNNVKWSLRMR